MINSPVLKALNVQSRFLRSAHLERDFTDTSALAGYIVTAEARSHLQRIAKGLQSESGQRAWRITGDYGSGKSSFALMLAHMFAGKVSNLPSPLRALPKELGISQHGPALLPVLVTGSREPLAQAVLRSIASAYIDAVGKQRSRLRNQVEEAVASLDTIADQQILALILDVAEELVAKGRASGILLILDELGKFLEFSALHPERQDVYFLQQLGESSARSKDTPLFTIGLLHQGFAAYADKLSDQSQREWEKVAGRFEELVFSQPMAQTAELLSAALGVDTKSCPKGWLSYSRTAMRSAVSQGLFGSTGNLTSLVNLAPQLYPLHPTVIPVVAHFFRRFGQNERSLFSFLLSGEPYGLMDFATRTTSQDSVYTLSDFYDYIAHNFAPRLSSQSFRSHWNYIDALIRSFPEGRDIELRALKTVGILNILELPELTPAGELIALALDRNDSVNDALSNLTAEGTLHYRGARSGYALWPHTSINLEAAFARATDSVSNVQNLAQEIRSRLDHRPLVARAHYIRTGTLRHFSVYFTSADEIDCGLTGIYPHIPAEGLLAIALCESADHRERAIKSAQKVDRPEILLGVSQPLESVRALVLELQRWHWVEAHTPELKDDRYAAEEVSRQIRATQHSLDCAIKRLIDFREGSNTPAIQWFHYGKQLQVLDGEHSIQSYISNFFDSYYSSAPRVHNELINRRQISSAAASARQKLIKAILENSHLPNLGLPEDKAPPEKSMYLSVIRASGVHSQVNGSWTIQYPKVGNADPCNIRPALDAITAELERIPDARVRVDHILAVLRKPPYGVRDGLSSLLLMVAIKELITELAIYEDGRFVPEVDEFLLTRLIKAPQTFEFQLCRLTGIRKELLSEFAGVVADDDSNPKHLLSIVRPLCTFVAELPEYARNTDRLSTETLKLRSEIIAAKEPADLIFRGIPSALGFGPLSARNADTAKLARSLQAALMELRRGFPELQRRMAAGILEAFEATENTLQEWREKVSPRAESVVVALSDPEMRAFGLKLLDEFSPENEWLEALGSFLVRCPPSRWKDKDEAAYYDRVRDLAAKFRRIEGLHFGPSSIAPQESVRIALTRKTGEERDRIVHLTAKQSQAAAELRKRLRRTLEGDDKVALAALTQLLWETLGESQ